ncbi:hypothetical protein [Antarcticimicrobium luteum]|uniref:hypothetical protein n=1 Tax=Antarcticimicrobium luteum TaxID=2547397 RepID=UPI003CCAC5F8
MLSGQIRRELSCASCGAPLHDLKMLRLDRAGAGGAAPAPAAKPPKRKKARRKKGLVARVLDEALDLVEDIFD